MGQNYPQQTIEITINSTCNTYNTSTLTTQLLFLHSSSHLSVATAANRKTYTTSTRRRPLFSPFHSRLVAPVSTFLHHSFPFIFASQSHAHCLLYIHIYILLLSRRVRSSLSIRSDLLPAAKRWHSAAAIS